MAIDRRRQAEQFLQQRMDVSGCSQIFAANHMRDALQRVIVHDRNVVTRRRVLATEDYIAVRFGMRRYDLFLVRSLKLFDKNQPGEIFAQQVL